MGYCEVEDVKAIVETDMEEDEIQDLIDETDAFVDLTVATASAMVKRAVSRHWTAYKVALKDPKSHRIGEISMDRGDMLDRMEKVYVDMLADAASDGGINLVIGKAEYER